MNDLDEIPQWEPRLTYKVSSRSVLVGVRLQTIPMRKSRHKWEYWISDHGNTHELTRKVQCQTRFSMLMRERNQNALDNSLASRETSPPQTKAFKASPHKDPTMNGTTKPKNRANGTSIYQAVNDHMGYWTGARACRNMYVASWPLMNN